MIRRCSAVCGIIVIMAIISTAQQLWDKKPYSEWSKEDLTGVLEKSPWSAVFAKSIESIGHIRASVDTVSGAEMKYDKLNFRFGFVTAKPIRMALARRSALGNAADAAKIDWGKYVDQENEKDIALVMYFSAKPAGSNVELTISEILDQLKTADLAGQTFLSSDGGKKVSLTQYDSLGENGYGVKFVFPRNLPDGTSLITANSKDVRFDMALAIPKDKRLEILPSLIPINCKWDVKKMIYQGKLVF
jgi:hypothetical protein